MEKIPGYKTLREYAKQYNLAPSVVSRQLKQGFCAWPQRRYGKAESHTKHPLYSVWAGMLQRCYNKNDKRYDAYGGRGIKVCTEWRLDFQQFVTDMGKRPAFFMLDRVNNDGDYTKENCKWSNNRDQSLNKRNSSLTPNLIQRKSSGSWYAAIRVCGRKRYTPDQRDIEQAEIDLQQLKRLYKEFL